MSLSLPKTVVMKDENHRVNLPRALITVTTVVSETELAREYRLRNVALDLKNLRTTLRFAVEPENKSRIRFSFNI